MAKKNFKGGLDSLFSDSKSESSYGANLRSTDTKIEQAQEIQDIAAPFSKQLQKLASIQNRTQTEIIQEAIHFYLEFQIELDTDTTEQKKAIE